MDVEQETVPASVFMPLTSFSCTNCKRDLCGNRYYDFRGRI